MDPEVMKTIDREIETIIGTWKEHGNAGPPPKRGKRSFKVRQTHPKNAPDALLPEGKMPNWAYEEFCRRAKYLRTYKAAIEALCRERFAERFEIQARLVIRQRIDAAQMSLPGFDLPKRVGNTPIAGTTLKAFFLHVERYRKSSQRKDDKLMAMEHVAKGVGGLYAVNPDMLLADAINQAKLEPLNKLILVKGANA
ncbi:MAG: hypothetical protein EPO02_12970 [Nitrospirae bacterium]|nr:MAG: hypothetical protein EPO02_12970 [Nitrospirota bacterium]